MKREEEEEEDLFNYNMQYEKEERSRNGNVILQEGGQRVFDVVHFYRILRQSNR